MKPPGMWDEDRSSPWLLALYAAAAALTLALSACGSGDRDDDIKAQLHPVDCAIQPEKCA